MTSLEARFESFRRTGDPDDLAAVYDATAPRLLRTALHLVSSASEAEDALQAAFVAAIEQRDRWDAARPLLPWLVGIVANQARLLRAKNRRTLDPDRVARTAAADPAMAASALEFTASVDAAIDRLPETYRAILVLHIRHGLPPADIAHALRRPPGTVRAQLARGLDKLRELLPAGLAGSLALTVHERGLAAVRQEVLAHVPAATAALPIAAVTAMGILTMKKLALVAAAAVAALFLWSPWADAPAATGGDVARGPESSRAATIERPRSQPGDAPASAAARVAVERVDAASQNDAPAAPTAAPVLHGRVHFAADGILAADVVVWMNAPSAVPRDRAETRTDATGAFAFAHLPATGVLVGTDRGESRFVGIEALGNPVELAIERGVRVHGRVVDDDAAPVPHAELWLSAWNDPTSGTAIAVTDEYGHFDLRDLGPRRYLGARASGHAPSPLRHLVAEPGASLEFELRIARGGAVLRGRVVRDDGSPAAHALVHTEPTANALYAPQPDGSFAPTTWPASVHADDRGEFAFASLWPGRTRVAARAAGAIAAAIEVDLAAAGSSDVLLQLQPAASVHGRVRRGDGAAIAGAILRVGEWNAFAHSRTQSGLDGSYAMTDVEPGSRELEVLVDNRLVWRQDLRLRSGEDRAVDVVVVDRPQLRGVVLGPAAKPLAGWQVMVLRDGVDGSAATATTGADGAFAFADLPVMSYRLTVGAVPHGRGVPAGSAFLVAAVVNDVVPGAGDLRIEVAAARLPECAVRARIVGADGRPAAGARISLGNMDGGGVVVVDVDAESGELAVEGLLPGPTWIVVHAAGMVEHTVGRRVLTAAQPLDLGELRLQTGTEVRGRLHLPPSFAAVARVDVTDERHSRIGSVTVTGSAFVTSPLLPGRYGLQVNGDGLAPLWVEFTVGAGPVPELQIDVAAGVPRELEATLPAGSAAPRWLGCTLMADHRAMFTIPFELRQDGRRTVTLWLGDADYRAVVASDDGRLRGELEIARGAEGPLRIALRRKD